MVLCPLIFTSCKKDNDINSKLSMLESDNYFPLSVGNYWKLDYIPRRTIDKTEQLDGINYYRMISEYDTAYYRKSTDGKVYSRTKSTNEILKFDLKASVGDTWTYKVGNSEYTWDVTLTSKTDTIKLNNCTFNNCYRFYYDIPQLADEEYVVWLAPGVGFVEEFYLGGTADRKKILKASINNIEIEF